MYIYIYIYIYIYGRTTTLASLNKKASYIGTERLWHAVTLLKTWWYFPFTWWRDAAHQPIHKTNPAFSYTWHKKQPLYSPKGVFVCITKQLKYIEFQRRVGALWPRLWSYTSLYNVLTQLPWTKWSPFCRRYFQTHFCEWKILYFG